MRVNNYNQKYSGEQILAEIRARGDQQKARTLAEQARQAEARLRAAKDPNALPETVAEIQMLDAKQLRRLMAYPDHKSHIEAVFAKHNKKALREQAKREAEADEANEKLQAQMAGMLGGQS